MYAAGRRPETVVDRGVTPVGLDITNPERVGEVALQLPDVTLLVNNAGVMKASSFIGTPSLEPARLEMETNYFGTLGMCRAFAPGLAANGGGAIVNMLSVSSFVTNPLDASYGASKAAAWSMTNGVRIEPCSSGHTGRCRARQLHRHRHGVRHRGTQGQPGGGRPTSLRRRRSRHGRGVRRRAVALRQGLAVIRPRVDLPVDPGVLGLAPEWEQLKEGNRIQGPDLLGIE